ncbi:MAG: hypothetical protein JSW27_24160, partial [Phycisphaerales bacterium]
GMLGEGTSADLHRSIQRDWPALRVDLVGPSRSTTLRTMLAEIDDAQKRTQVREDLGSVTIFSPWSTASPALLTSILGDKTAPNAAPVSALASMFDLITSRFDQVGIKFVRMIGTDDLLALHLLQELRRRRIDVRAGQGDHIALISEWDMLYGKAFPLTFATMMECLGSNGEPPDWADYTQNLLAKLERSSRTPFLPANLHAYSYLRGIDGRLPTGADSKAAVESTQDEQERGPWTYNESLEVPIGRGQLDYVRRLTRQLRAEFRGPGKPELRAIGVVGTDVYDKMILLHALQEEFGSITLFTTDLDARLMHYERSRWTRNVIVASNFGLALNPKYQYGIRQLQPDSDNTEGAGPHPSPLAPFRDNYQTALFLACRAALGLAEEVDGETKRLREFEARLLAEALGYPRLFEIGRGQAVDLSVTEGEPKVNLHPSQLRFRAKFSTTLFRAMSYLGMTAVLLLPVYLLLRGHRPHDTEPARPADKEHRQQNSTKESTARPSKGPKTWVRHPRRVALPILASLAIVVFIILVLVDHDQRQAGEPFSLTAGTSAWPGLALLLLGILLGIRLLLYAWTILADNVKETVEEFELRPPREHKEGWPGCRARIRVKILWGLGIEVPESDKKAIEEVDEFKDGKVIARGLWTKHFLRRCVGRDFLWPIGWLVLLWLLPVVLGPGLGWPYSPCRGALCYAVFLVTGSLYYTTLLALLVTVATATMRRMKVINELIAHDTFWKSDAGREPDSEAHSDQEPKYMAHWRDVRFIARITEGVSRVLYFPSIILLFSIAARMRYFDNWGYPLLVLITYSVPFIYLIGLEAALQLCARRARAVALREMRRELHKARYGEPKEDEKGNRIQSMMDEVTELREGAFRPFSENPIVAALLIPSGGAGLLAVLAYFLPG